MACGCVPVILERPGASEQYDERWVHQTPEGAARAIIGLVEDDLLRAEQILAAEYVRRWSLEAIMPVWDELLSLPSPRPVGTRRRAAEVLG
jgi:hypothetical protein